MVLGVAGAFALTGVGILAPRPAAQVDDVTALCIEQGVAGSKRAGGRAGKRNSLPVRPAGNGQAVPPVDAVTGPYQTECR